MAPDVSLICDAGLFMFQSRSQWQFTWWTHKNAKYSPVTHFWESEAELTCHVSPVSIFTVWGWDRSRVLADTRQCGLCRGQTTVRARRDSVGVRSVSLVHHSVHVTHHVSWSSESWRVTVVKCDSNSLKLSSISLSGCDKRNSPIKLFLTSAESQHQTFRDCPYMSTLAWAHTW